MASAVVAALRPWQALAKTSIVLAALAGTFVGAHHVGYASGWADGYGEVNRTYEEAYYEGYRNGLKDRTDIGRKSEEAQTENPLSPEPPDHRFSHDTLNDQAQFDCNHVLAKRGLARLRSDAI